jgi:threonine dehydratase
MVVRVTTPLGSPPGLLPWYAHPAARTWTCAPASASVQAFHAGLPGYAPTPLTKIPAIAAELGVGRVFVKDEFVRMGLAAFKVLGASAVLVQDTAWPGYEQLPGWIAEGHPTLFTKIDAQLAQVGAPYPGWG